MEKKSSNKWVSLLVVICIGAAILAAIFNPHKVAAGEVKKEEVVLEQSTDVPPAPPEPEVKKGCGWNVKCWREAADKWWKEEELKDAELESLRIRLDQANARILGHDELLEGATAQVKKTEQHFEGLLKAAELEVETFRTQNQKLSQAIADLESKESSMTYVEGCWVSIEQIQTDTQ